MKMHTVSIEKCNFMKVPKPKKLKSGAYRIRLQLGEKSVMVYGSTEAECKRNATAIKADHLTGKVVQTKCTLTVTQAIDKYIADHPNLSPSTVCGYRNIQRNVFTDAMKLIADCVPWQKIIDNDAHSAKTIKNAWTFMRSVLRHIGIEPPNIRLKPVQTAERNFLEPEQIPIFLDAIHGKSYELAALLGLHSLRRSEIMDVTYNDIDLQHDTIHVRGAAVVDEHGKLVHKKENKNASSTRDVPIMIPRLKELVEDGGDGYVVTINPNNVYRGINRVCSHNNLPQVGIHGLRHSAVSLAYHLRWDEKTSMQIFGYSDFNTMRKIYTHLAENDKKKNINAMTQFFKTAPKQHGSKKV